MGGGPKQKDEAGKLQRTETTLRIRIYDPEFDSLIKSFGKGDLAKIKAYLDGLSPEHSNDYKGLNFQAFKDNLQGHRVVRVDGQALNIVATSGSAFLVFFGPPPFVELSQSLPSIDFTIKRSIVSDPQGRKAVIIRLTSAELRQILLAAAYAHLDSDGQTIDIPEFKNFLRRCSVVASIKDNDGNAFDFNDFCDRISIVSDLDSGQAAASYLVGLDGDENIYAIFVNIAVPDVNPKNPLLCKLSFEGGTCSIYRQDII